MASGQENFIWRRHPEADALVRSLIRDFVAKVPPVAELEEEILGQTSTHLREYIDQIVIPAGGAPAGQLSELGFVEEEQRAAGSGKIMRHPGAEFPRIRLAPERADTAETTLAVGIQVEDLPRFLMTWGRHVPIEGPPLSPSRHAIACETEGRRFIVGERRIAGELVPREMPPEHAHRHLQAFEQWSTRRRRFPSLEEGLAATRSLAGELVGRLGVNDAAWATFAGERAYWQQRNAVAREQKRRQDAFGLGWANHDHHTFRSSRRAFPGLIGILETFGFRCRERFYAGAEAGWGAQVLEQPACNLVVFADVDLGPDEVTEDFAHRTLPERRELGTVGLWCALHGESILEAGLHHLAACFDFECFREDIEEEGYGMLEPFSDFPHLRQAFSEGEGWAVERGTAERLCAEGIIDEKQRDRFIEHGAVGSHVENIQRSDGFRGFNQQGVSDIIRRTDPRASTGA